MGDTRRDLIEISGMQLVIEKNSVPIQPSKTSKES